MRCAALLVVLAVGCAGAPRERALTIAASDVGAEGQILRAQLARFTRDTGVAVEIRSTPDAADERHRLYVQWLGAGVAEPDVLQLDVVWTAELAAAGFLAPFDERALAEDTFPAARSASTWNGTTWAVPWFVDVGMLYYRTDLAPAAPSTLEQLTQQAAAGARGFVWQGARYEGLTCVFLEILGAYGGALVDDAGAVTVDTPEAVRALTTMRDWLRDGVSPPETAAAQEEQVRAAFQSGSAMFMRNWPYAAALLDDDGSPVRGRFAVTRMPPASATGATRTAALGGAVLAVNARSAQPERARALIAYLTSPAAALERARVAGQYPPLRSLYDEPALDDALSVEPRVARAIIDAAVARPSSPFYAELSATLQVHLHRALTNQAEPRAALDDAARAMRAIMRDRGAPQPTMAPSASTAAREQPPVLGLAVLAVLAVLASLIVSARNGEQRLASALAAPALVVMALCAAVPLALTFWESLFDRDLRMPWRGAPFVGLGNYTDAFGDERVREALLHTAAFVVVTVTLEVVLGLAIALAMTRAFRGRGLVRSAVLVPWAMPTVVAGVLWRFMFDGPSSPANALLSEPIAWLAHPVAAWVPLVVADVWKTTPFVALLLMAGLAGIDESVDEAARMDGAGPVRRLFSITLPLLKPALTVALVFRTLDAVRVFDLVVALTGGGPGTATEPITLLAFDATLKSLRFGDGAALSVIVFVITMIFATLYVRLLGEERA